MIRTSQLKQHYNPAFNAWARGGLYPMVDEYMVDGEELELMEHIRKHGSIGGDSIGRLVGYDYDNRFNLHRDYWQKGTPTRFDLDFEKVDTRKYKPDPIVPKVKIPPSRPVRPPMPKEEAAAEYYKSCKEYFRGTFKQHTHCGACNRTTLWQSIDHVEGVYTLWECTEH